MKKHIYPKNEMVLYLSIIISTLLPLLISYLLYPKISGKLPLYSDLIAGATTWSGYNKAIDLTLFFVYLFLYLLLLIFMPLVLNLIIKKKAKVINIEKEINYNSPLLFLIGTSVLLIPYFILTKIFPFNTIIALGFCYLIFLLTGQSKLNKTELFTKICLLSIFAYFNLIAFNIVLDKNFRNILPFFEVNYNYMFVLIMFAILFVASMISSGKIKENALDKLLTLSQILLPLLFFAFYKFRYIYRTETVTQYNSVILKHVCLFAIIIMISHNIYVYYQRYKNTLHEKSILITTIVSLSAFFSYKLPFGSLLTDYFHIGELTVPVQQLIEYGSLPHFDYIPVHGGFYDYFSGLINYVFFNGEYATMPAAISISQIFLAIIVCFVIIYFVEGELFPFVISILCANAASVLFDRWLGVFIMLIILHSKKMDKNPIRLLWWWILTSIIAIAWYPSIGGCASISFIPLVIYSFVRKDNFESLTKLGNKSYKNKLLMGWVPLILIGCSLIPIFIKIVEYVLLYARSTLQANGTSASYAITNGAINFFGNQMLNASFTLIVLPLGFTLIVGLLLISSYKFEKLRTRYLLIALQVVLLIGLSSSYSFGRVDGNFPRATSAVTVINIAVIASIGSYLTKNTMYKPIILMISIILVIAFRGSMGNLFEQHKKAYVHPVINSEFIRFDGEKEGIKNLGTIYSSQEEINQLIDINSLLENKDSFLNLTNLVAYHSIFNKKDIVPFSSIYMTVDYEMHKRYLSAIENNSPEIILIYPKVAHDSGTAAFRAYPVYRYIIEKGYIPYKHDHTLFLLPQNSPDSSIYEKAYDEFSRVMHRHHLGYLPILWGSEKIIGERVVPSFKNLEIFWQNQIDEINGEIAGNNAFIAYQLDMPINGIENDFIKVSLNSEYDLRDESDFIIFWADEGEDAFSEEKSFFVTGDNGNLLIPMGTSPYWSFSNNIKYIGFGFPATMEGKRLPDIKLDIYKYSDKYK